MTRDEIISMARDAGFVLADNATDEAVNRFRRLIVLAKEEERDAEVWPRQRCLPEYHHA